MRPEMRQESKAALWKWKATLHTVIWKVKMACTVWCGYLFNAQNKRMTSFTSVYVAPLVDDSIEIEINPADITGKLSSGAGGRMWIKWKREWDAPCPFRYNHWKHGGLKSEQGKCPALAEITALWNWASQKTGEGSEIRSQKKKIEWGSQIGPTFCCHTAWWRFADKLRNRKCERRTWWRPRRTD